jgi:hypothetical protein
MARFEWKDTVPMWAREILKHDEVVNLTHPENGHWGLVAELSQATSGAAQKLGEIARHCLNGGWYNEEELEAVRQLDRLERLVTMMRERVETARRTERNT